MSYYFDPLDGACKSCIGAIPRGSELALRIYQKSSGEASFSAQTCTLVLMRDGGETHEIPMHRTEYGFSVALRLNWIGLYFYHFRLDNALFGCGRGRCGEFTEQITQWQITVFDEDFVTPDWFKGGIMYQIFPDRFYKGDGEYPIGNGKILRDDWGGTPSYRPDSRGKVLNNDFFGGNFNGVRQKLGYLKSLNVTTIYFNPIFEAYSNHRYDTGDYMKIDPLLGTEEDFNNLVSEARALGIRIILDGVFNHTGDNSRYFNKYGNYDELGAYQSRESVYADWYRFRNFPDDYESWWGIDILPAVNEDSDAYQDFICGEQGVIRHWLQRGAGGYRLDVADELPDYFLEMIRCTVKDEDPEAIIIGEVWEDASNKIAYSQRRKYLQGLELDSVMNYPLKDAIIRFVVSGNAHQLRETIAMLIDNYPKPVLDCLMNILSTHDTARILTVLGGKICANKDEMSVTFLSDEEREIAIHKLKMAAVLQYMLPGVPCIYYGDEIGMEGYQDPFCRCCFPWENAEGDLLDFYRKLGEIRSKILVDILRDGEYHEVFADGNCIVFERRNVTGCVYIYVNNHHTEYTIHMQGDWYEYLSEMQFFEKHVIKGYSYGIIAKNYVRHN